MLFPGGFTFPNFLLRFRKPSEIECGCLGLIVPKLCSTSQLT
jgi:hypothetical protein